MILSHSKKFIFIHVFKTAGNNIRAELKKHSFLRSRKNRLLCACGFYPSIYSDDFRNHTTAKEVKEKLPGKIYGNYFKFGFIRNPWDWHVSLYHYMIQNKKHRQHELIKKMTFDEYILWRAQGRIQNQAEFLYEGSKLLVDFVGKVERFQSDFDLICKNIGVENRIVPIRNKSNHKHYSEYYSDRSIRIIEQIHKTDIDLFHYKFES